MRESGDGAFEGYAYAGVRALVELHDRTLRSFVAAWKQADADGIILPLTSDPDCESLSAMLRHVLRAARGYMTWTCEVLSLGDPEIRPVPEDLTEGLDQYVDHLLGRWDGPLRTLEADAVEQGTYPSRWGAPYSIDAMLEHAVVHPLRHELQLERARNLCALD